jgi:hypothetical protein
MYVKKWLLLLRSAILLKEESNYDDGVVLEAVVEKYVKYFKSILHHNR